MQLNILMTPRQNHARCDVLQSAPHYICGRTFHSAAGCGLSITCSSTGRAVCCIHYCGLRPVIEYGLPWLVIANDVDWPPLVGISPSIQRIAEAGELFGFMGKMVLTLNRR